MKKVICNFMLFGMDQPIYVYDEEAKTYEKVCISSFDQLAEDLVRVCEMGEYKNIQLYGPAKFAEQIVEDVKEKASLYYSLNDIEIEVNK